MTGPGIVVLCGGVGGAKLVRGLHAVLPADALRVVVNTGDDFEHLGLHISPDLDTVLYTLAELSDPVRGWGRHDETWHCMAALADVGGATWFALGDRDLALHLERSRRLGRGETLSAIVRDMTRHFRIHSSILPMSDDAVRTMVQTTEGEIAFQEYFVRRRCEPVVTGVRFAGAATARPQPVWMEALMDPGLSAIVIAPSNPYLSVDPILALPGIRDALATARAPVIAVSPIVGGDAVKGPTAKIMRELGIAVSCRSIAAHYAGLLDGLVVDDADADSVDGLDVPVRVAQTLMQTLDDRCRLARDVLDFAKQLQPALQTS